jgi:hypothetical protein
LREAARRRNYEISDQSAQLTALIDIQGNYPGNFPETREALETLTPLDLRSLLESYQLSMDGTAAQKKRRFAKHIGLRF